MAGQDNTHKRTVVCAALVAAIALGAGTATGSDAASPFDTYGGWPGGNPAGPGPDERGPTIARKGVTTSARASRSGAFVFTVGPFAENVRGSVTFATASAISAKKPRKRRLSFGRKAFRVQAGRPVRLRIQLSRRSRGALRRYRKLKIKALVSARDQSLNTTERSFTFTLKRPR